MITLSDAGRAWENTTLNDHLRDWDVSEARDRAIEDRADALLAGDYSPFSDRIIEMFRDATDLGDLLLDLRPLLVSGDHAAVGAMVARRLHAYAAAEAAEEARIQIDRHAEL